MIEISHSERNVSGEINISGSKSESNRWLVLKAIFNSDIVIENLSNSRDTEVLQQALNSQEREIDIGHAGTAMRFLTAYFATLSDREVMLTGSTRMQQRPIGPLVDALNSLGANITYFHNDGFPPLLIKGKKLVKSQVDIRAGVSSQYITALMLIAPSLPDGLTINFKGDLTSRPYVEMTKSQFQSLGIQVEWVENGIKVYPKSHIQKKEIYVESDWSSVSYWYSIAALSDECHLKLSVFKENSLQGDSVLKDIYAKYFGVETKFIDNVIKLSKNKYFKFPAFIEIDLNNAPDIAQTIIVTCAGLGIKAKLSGLHTLKIKETDRLVALKNELEKVGTRVRIDNDSIEIISFTSFKNMPAIETYNDHRMAMSFAPLGLKFPIKIMDKNVVEKSYPNFWNDLETLAFIVTTQA